MNGKVYFLDITDVLYTDEMINSLPGYCVNKINKVNNVNLKKSRVLSWYFLKKILLTEKGIDLCNVDIWENEYGKPYINEIYFNITHSDNYIGIIIGSEECGIDIEKIELNVNKDKFAEKILTKEEFEEYNQNNEVDYLIKKWTKIETHYKILGEGLTLSKLNKEINNTINTILLDKGYYLSYGPFKCEIINIAELVFI